MDLAMAFWGILVNPNVAYVLLIIGLWALIAAFATPGTGIPEVAAAICLTLAVMGLARLSINTVGLALIGISMVMFLIDLNAPSHGALTLGGVTALGIGSVFLFRPEAGQPGLSLWVIGLSTLGTGLFFGVALAAAVRAQTRPLAMDPTAVAGQTGEVRQALAPTGTVQLRSELWSAKSETPGEIIESGTRVVVTSLDGLELVVKKVA